MKHIMTLAILILIIPNAVQSQEKEYPYPLKPGERFVSSASVDTLFWVLKNSQYTKAIVNSLELTRAKEIIGTLELKMRTLEEVIALKDSTNLDYREGYDRYRKRWEETDIKLEDREIKLLKLRRWTLFSAVLGVGAGVLVGVLVF